ncbi:reverse transcriptase domain-containing protein [Streptomyces rubiginosohelvolus]|uniref:reverse transcriptase domain-containing protein n=1 Tax=Streptomyces TaxID=1883 RepID=UPI000BF16763|nr:reverse transcriptase domain-containing protein [Streptomyces sp. f51]
MPFEDDLRAECRKLILRHEQYAQDIRDDDERRSERTGRPHRGTVHRPSYWSADRAFNPYKVRSSATSIAYAVQQALAAGQYTPYNPIAYEVPKGDGATRQVSVFPVADATVSRRVYKSLLEKNQARFSSYSFAYRNDLSAHDAIRHISSELNGRDRVFLAEYDFTKFFDSISHDYVWRIIKDHGFLVSSLEKSVIDSFLATHLQSQGSYQRLERCAGQGFGLPQGTSISLFLANVAAWELDRTLERLGVGFARYADDTLIWSNDYSLICKASDTLSGISQKIGAELNFRKSHGISIFTPEGTPVELKSKSRVEFVGYKFDSHGTGMRASAVARIKRRISYLIWVNLLEPLTSGETSLSRLTPKIDRDYQVMLWQIRRYLYGDLSEKKLRRLMSGRARRIHFPGVMAYFPLVSDISQLKELDGWMAHTIWTSLNKRRRILMARGIQDFPIPHGLSESQLLKARTRSKDGSEIDLRMPSFVRIGTCIHQAATAHGPNAVGRKSGPLHYEYGM